VRLVQPGEINYYELEETCRRVVGEGGSVVCVVNVGSTVRGAHDRLDKMLESITKAGVPDAKKYVSPSEVHVSND
jgi:phosphoribosylamine-glycine ligase